MKRILAIATLLLATGSVVPVQAVSVQSRTTPIDNSYKPQSEGILIADKYEDQFKEYRYQRHLQLERQMRQELTQPKYRYMSQQEKERVMKQAHDNLDDALDRQEKAWTREQEKRQDRYDRYDRYNRYNRYDRYDDPQNPYDQRYRYERSRYNQRYNNRWDY
jgi:predicted metal-dependent peptidase